MNYNNKSNNKDSEVQINQGISRKSPVIMIFLLSEFEETCGKLEIEIPNKIYNCPFYIYDKSLDELDLTFENEEEINDIETQLGFDILDKIWLDYVGKATNVSINKLFVKTDITEEEFSVQPKLGFIPGYDLVAAKEEAKKNNFNVIQWKIYWEI